MEYIRHEQIKEINTKISDEVVKHDLELIKACYQCGTCTGSCPSGRLTALRTRAVIRRALLGLEEVLSDPDIWLCSTCYTCYSRCPRNIPVTDIIIELRNIATQHGYIRDSHKNLTHMLIDTGHGVPLPEGESNWSNLRKSYGLPERPPTVHSFPNALKEVQTLVHSLGFDKLVEYPRVIEEKSIESEGKNGQNMDQNNLNKSSASSETNPDQSETPVRQKNAKEKSEKPKKRFIKKKKK
ncbi:MAG: CoB--CoM heterodisulfide reductase subunit C [Promethearchaeota archaeon]